MVNSGLIEYVRDIHTEDCAAVDSGAVSIKEEYEALFEETRRRRL